MYRERLHPMWVEYFKTALERGPNLGDDGIAWAAQRADAMCAAQSRREERSENEDDDTANAMRVLLLRVVETFGEKATRKQVRDRLLAIVDSMFADTLGRAVEERAVERTGEGDGERFEEAIPF